MFSIYLGCVYLIRQVGSYIYTKDAYFYTDFSGIPNPQDISNHPLRRKPSPEAFSLLDGNISGENHVDLGKPLKQGSL